MKNRFLGIDLGTTYSCVSYLDDNDQPVVLSNREGENTTPSVVMFGDNDSVIVGKTAKAHLKTDGDKIAQFAKRYIGKEDDTVFANGKDYSATQISSLILKKVVQDANSRLKELNLIENDEFINDVVITCPAYFGMNEKDATKAAGEAADLNVLDIINEPTAAAISYGLTGEKKNETVLVYDLGGGTFDTTIMKINERDIHVLASLGHHTLGGKDWDEEVISYIVNEYKAATNVDILEDMDLMDELYLDVENMKKTLTSNANTKIMVRGDGGKQTFEFTRELFDNITKSKLETTISIVDKTLKLASEKGYTVSAIDKFILVGGSSYMPQVSEAIKEKYGVEPLLKDPNEAVAKGAAIFAKSKNDWNCFIENEAIKEGKTVEELEFENICNDRISNLYAKEQSISSVGRISISDVVSRTYGIGTYFGDDFRIQNMIMINDKLPTKITKQFLTRDHNQYGLNIEIYESESKDDVIDINGRKPITCIYMSFVESVPKDTLVEITCALDNTGLLHVNAIEKLKGSTLNTSFKLSNQMTDEQLSKLADDVHRTNVE